ncbi:MAG: crossover junction endodeoxyribonuclease RuvC [Methylococcaceae bacterium]|nr:crossover junction endodeoxyribonuclease RuvC [Methylococcaceae bacterium]MCI0668478.1 crossover junction endodeoxyribonuclease RuvC [Methylococcaceae bacterium]MCI0732651.1 crossover junction endodeoxyribonuclease RuvC [Methylococcaceae bacterium]
MSRILGIDPGSRITGFGVIDDTSGGLRYVASGCVRVTREPFSERLKQIFEGIGAVVREHRPDQLAIEQVFMHKNADSALKLGQARGAAICAVIAHELPVYEYAARQVKQALVGSGSAEKCQVQHMIRVLLGLQGELQADAGDALGVALCHIHIQQTRKRLNCGRIGPTAP